MRERLLQTFLPAYHRRRQYLNTLSYQHRSFDVKGLTTQGLFTLALEKVFVDLSLGLQTYRRASADPIRPMPQRDDAQRRDLNSYLADKQMKGRNLVILGPPGSGKTTLLKYTTLMLAARKPPAGAGKAMKKLPLLLFLRDHTAAIIQNPDYSLSQAVKTRLAVWELEALADWLDDQLRKGRCLIMLDGLDEVADPNARRQVVDWVEGQMARYGRNQFIITSRPFGYRSNPLQDATELEIRPFNSQQVQQFIRNWYLANELMSAQRDDPGVRMAAQKGAEDLLWRLRQTPVLLDMAVNPLLLTMIATVHRYRSNLPGRRVELYAEIVEVFLGKWQQAKGMSYKLTPAQKRRVLETMAFHMMQQRQRDLPLAEAIKIIAAPLNRVMRFPAGQQAQAAQDFLKMVENSSGLLVEREAGLYGFAHLTFQEYLAAVHVRDQKQESDLTRQVEDSWWHETIRLYAAQADATNIVRACLSRPKPSVPALTLAMECLEEAREVNPELRTVFDRLAQSVEHENPDVRRLAAEVLLALRLRRLVRVDENKYIDSSLITHAEFQRFLDEESAYANYYLPDHWTSAQFLPGEGRTAVTGARPADAQAFCDWLTRREGGSQWLFRLPRMDEREQIAQQSTARGSTSEQVGYWYTAERGFACTRFDYADAVQPQMMSRQLEQRILYDWTLEDRGEQMEAALPQVQELILSRAQQRRFMLFDFERDPGPAFNPLLDDLNRARDRFSAAQAHHLDAVLRDAVQRAESLDVAQARTIDLDGVAALVEALQQDLAQAEDVEHSEEIGLQIARHFEYALSLTHKQNVVMNAELIRALNQTRHAARDASFLLDRAIVRARARVRSRLLAQIVGLLLEFETERGNGRKQIPASEKRTMAAYIDWYLNFALLEGRVNRKLPAVEGIFIVRERRGV